MTTPHPQPTKRRSPKTPPPSPTVLVRTTTPLHHLDRLCRRDPDPLQTVAAVLAPARKAVAEGSTGCQVKGCSQEAGPYEIPGRPMVVTTTMRTAGLRSTSVILCSANLRRQRYRRIQPETGWAVIIPLDGNRCRKTSLSQTDSLAIRNRKAWRSGWKRGGGGRRSEYFRFVLLENQYSSRGL